MADFEILRYRGEVKVSIVKNNRVISSMTYNNKGCEPLFRFLCECLKGEYSVNARPFKIKLYGKSNQEEINSPFSEMGWQGYEKSSGVTYLTTSNVEKVVDEFGVEYGCKITYQFRIPYSQLFGDTTNERIYKAALFAKVDTYSSEDIYAYFRFLNEDGDEWSPIEVNRSENKSIIIEWSLILQNK